jgi:hypothetical protein
VTDRADQRLAAGDAPVREAADRPSVNELHAALLGACLGVLSAQTGRDSAALLVALTALVWPARGPVGLRTLRREPWWALVGLVVGVAVGERAGFSDS